MDQKGSVISVYRGSSPLDPPSAKGTFRIRASIIIHTLFCTERQKRGINGKMSLVSCFSDPNEPRNSDLSLRRIAQFNLQGQLIILTRTT